MVMMAPKDVRPLLANLSADSLISIQEVPKSADRNPTRTFYLWWVVWTTSRYPNLKATLLQVYRPAKGILCYPGQCI